MTVQHYPHLRLNEHGRPALEDSRIKVSDIVEACIHGGESIDAYVEGHPFVTLAQMHAALAYYYDHREEIEREIADGEAEAERLRPLVEDPIFRARAEEGFAQWLAARAQP